jgi:hypothetical protein
MNVYEYRPRPVGDPNARERAVWVIFGGGGALMFVIALIVALTSKDGLGEGFKKSAVFLVLGIVIAILPLGLRHGIRAQNARRDAFSVAVTDEGALEVSSIKNVGGRMEKPRFEPDEHRISLSEVAKVSFEKETYESGHGNNAYRSISHFLCIDRTDGMQTKVLLPTSGMGQSTGLPPEEQKRFHAAAAPYLARQGGS